LVQWGWVVAVRRRR